MYGIIINIKMNPTASELPKLVAILTQFNDKLESQVNKKYRPFLKALLTQRIQDRNKNPNPDKISLGEEIIAFKLGVQSKSTKCIEMTLGYLYKLLSQGLIDLSEPNYCEDFIITEANIEKKKCQNYDKEMRHEIVKWLEPLVHFKNNQIIILVLKNYQYLIGEPILQSLMEISNILPSEQCFNLLHSYFNYRFYLYEEVYYYTQSEIQQFKHITTNERLAGQINNAIDRQEGLENLIERYLCEVIAKVAKEGGKYGVCVVCNQPAEYFCKVTKASLCGLDCKKKHLEIAQKQYKNYYESIIIYKSIIQSMEIFSKQLSEKQSPFLFSVLASLIEKPYLFQLVKREYKAQIHKYLPGILYKAYESKNDQITEALYFMISSLAKWWPTQCLSQIQYFIKEHILKVLTDRKPSFRLLILVFKSLDKIFEHGRSIVELYINLDCQMNQVDVIGSILFQLSKIAQDKFSNSNHYNKQQKITIKNSCMTLFMTFSRSLNDYRRNYANIANVKEIDKQKIRKSDLEKFVQKFNEHWSEGLKSLFNLNLVGLDSNHEIVNIIMSLAGLNKKIIDLMLFDKTCEQYLEIFMSRLAEADEPLVLKLLSFYKFVPMTENNSIGVLKFVQNFGAIYKMPDFLNVVKRITTILIRSETFEDFRNRIKQHVPPQSDFKYLYLRMLTARKLETTGKKKRFYTACLSQSYLQPLSSQITLLQIPLSYMIETGYDADKIVNLIKQLIPICIHSNWLALLVKHSGIDHSSEQLLTPYNIKIIKGILETTTLQADFIADWLTILSFISNVYYLVSLNHPSSKKYLTENKTILFPELLPGAVQGYLINTSLKCVNNFNKFMIGVLTIAREHLMTDQIMMLQKFFHMLDANIDKYITNFYSIYEEFRKFVEQLKNKTSSQTYIYIADMLKQLLLKCLKSTDMQDNITVRHLQIFHIILHKNRENREIGDFVMNCLSTIVVYNYNLKPRSWRQIIKIVDEQAANYSYQAGVIIRKILNEHMKSIEDESEKLLDICFKLIKSDDQKSSVQAIHDIKLILDLQRDLIQADIATNTKQPTQPTQNQNENQNSEVCQREIQNLKRLLLHSINKLIEYIGETFSEQVAQTLFLLFNQKIESQETTILGEDELNDIISRIFDRLEQIEKDNLETAERIMNETLYWSTKNKNKGIVKNLEKTIINKYTNLSITAIKCLKTYIQMSNPRDQKQWQDVEQTLLKIIKNAEIERFFHLETIPDQSAQQIIQNLLNNKLTQKISGQLDLDINMFVHECRVQMMCVELLPNHKRCLGVLEDVYEKKIRFNDMVLLRMLLWKKGIGRDFPPDVLNLEQTISNRIMAIHMWENVKQNILNYCYKILQKYLSSSKYYSTLLEHESKINSSCNPENRQLYSILVDYWNKRRQPLSKLISYIMPKLIKFCENKQDRKILLLYFVKLIPLMENKEAVLKVVGELSQKTF